jgi:integrase
MTTVRSSYKYEQSSAAVCTARPRADRDFLCPVHNRTKRAAGISEGLLFRPVAKGGRLSNQRLTDKTVCDLVKAYAGRLGLKEADFGAHSLRAGFLTSAARRGASVFKMRDVSRHKSMDVLQAYVRDADIFKDHAGIGLL